MLEQVLKLEIRSRKETSCALTAPLVAIIVWGLRKGIIEGFAL